MMRKGETIAMVTMPVMPSKSSQWSVVHVPGFVARLRTHTLSPVVKDNVHGGLAAVPPLPVPLGVPGLGSSLCERSSNSTAPYACKEMLFLALRVVWVDVKCDDDDA